MDAVCQVCFHHCRLKEGQWGICRARKNENGMIVCGNYGKITSLALDPIEKKPLNMFCPGSKILSVGSFGCNLRCPFCQNYEISMAGREIPAVSVTPEELVDKAIKEQPFGNIGVAFTYNEPFIGWEFVRDVSRLLKEQGMKSVVVTNGTVSVDILQELLPYIDAMNIDLKGFTREYYEKIGGDFEMVKECITIAASSCHVELTTLIVPGENDSLDQMEEEAKWIAALRDDIPLHVTRFYPRYHFADKEPTDVSLVYALADAARKYLKHVFVGNC